MFKDYLQSIDSSHSKCLEDNVVKVVLRCYPDASEGLSYGLPALVHTNGKPLVGFSSNKHGLNIYPYNPKIITAVTEVFPSLEHSKGVIRFKADDPIPRGAVELMLELRLKQVTG